MISLNIKLKNCLIMNSFRKCTIIYLDIIIKSTDDSFRLLDVSSSNGFLLITKNRLKEILEKNIFKTKNEIFMSCQHFCNREYNDNIILEIRYYTYSKNRILNFLNKYLFEKTLKKEFEVENTL